MEFPGGGCFKIILRSGPLKRDTYAKLPDGVEKVNISRKLLNPAYGLSTACKDWFETIQDFLANERGGLLP